MGIHVTGTARILDHVAGTVVQVPASAVAWVPVGTIERPDGTATMWEGTATVEGLGELIWSVQENPGGELGPVEHDLSPDCVLQDFEIRFG